MLFRSNNIICIKDSGVASSFLKINRPLCGFVRNVTQRMRSMVVGVMKKEYILLSGEDS